MQILLAPDRVTMPDATQTMIFNQKRLKNRDETPQGWSKALAIPRRQDLGKIIVIEW